MKTSDLQILQNHPSRFTWGPIVEFYTLGPYTIAEFKPIVGSEARKKAGDPDPTEFHVWVDGKDTHTGARSLEEAIVLAIGIRNLGANSGRAMAQAALKVLK